MHAKEINIDIQSIPTVLANQQDISLHMARLDLIDPVVSGNKLFKLQYFIEEAVFQNKKNIVSMGGAFSNHLAATASYCKKSGLNSIGLVRGEENQIRLSHTLQSCQSDNMELIFLSREAYKKIDPFNFKNFLPDKYNNNENDFYFIPEGGHHPLGAQGASIIMDKIAAAAPTHIIVPVGTATTLAGIAEKAGPNVDVIGITVLKGMTDIESRINYLLPKQNIKYPTIIHDYHFGGYAKKTNALITFMNDFFDQYQIPTDFVYTGKMMFGVFDLINKKHFPAGSNIICLHTGGLQGNHSLDVGSLVF